MTTSSTYLLQYYHQGKWRSAIFHSMTDAREWGDYLFHGLKGCNRVELFDLDNRALLWQLPQVDWNHNER